MCSWSAFFLAGAGVSDICALQRTGKNPTVVSSWLFRRTVSPELEFFLCLACVTASFLDDQRLRGVWLSTFLTPVAWETIKDTKKPPKKINLKGYSALSFLMIRGPVSMTSHANTIVLRRQLTAQFRCLYSAFPGTGAGTDTRWWYWREVTFTTLLPLLINCLYFPTGC